MIIYKANDGKRAENIFDDEKQTVTHLQLKAGESIGEHKVDHTVVVVPYKGKIKFSDENSKEEIYPGVIVRMLPGELHSLEAVEDSDLMVIKSHLK